MNKMYINVQIKAEKGNKTNEYGYIWFSTYVGIARKGLEKQI